MAKTTIQRFEEKYIPEPNSGCWLWLGALTHNGYAVLSIGGKTERAHRWAYASAHGPIPPDMELDHLCRVRCCVNPSHLEVVTSAENGKRSPFKGSKTHCVRGHEFTDKNTYWRKEGRRNCLECRRIGDSKR